MLEREWPCRDLWQDGFSSVVLPYGSTKELTHRGPPKSCGSGPGFPWGGAGTLLDGGLLSLCGKCLGSLWGWGLDSGAGPSALWKQGQDSVWAGPRFPKRQGLAAPPCPWPQVTCRGSRKRQRFTPPPSGKPEEGTTTSDVPGSQAALM